MRLIKFILTGIIFIGMISSCSKKFLTVIPEDQLTTANFPSNEADAEAALTGVYHQLQNFSTFGDQTMTALLEWTTTGDIYEQDQNTDRVNIERLNFPADNFYTTNLYQGLFRGVNQANFVINVVGKMSNIDASAKSSIIAQARFLRGVFYFYLVNYFGGVSLITQPLSASSSLNVPRSTEKDCWAQIESDFKYAASVLPTTWSGADLGRATEGAALAFLVKSYLWQQKWDSATTTSQEIINLGVYSLLPNYRDVFAANNGNNSEIVFAVQFSSAQNGIAGMQEDVRSAPRGFPAQYVGRDAWSNFVPRQEWVNAFDTNQAGQIIDQRYYGSVIGPGEEDPWIPGFSLPTQVPNQGTSTGYIVIKWWQGPSPVNVGVDYPIIRYPEVLLNYAEALNEIGQSEEAIKQINIVRARAGQTPDPLTLTHDQILSDIFHQARLGYIWEFYGGFSMLNRRGLFLSFIQQHNPEYNEMNVSSKPWLQTNPILLPIPLAAWELNHSLVQNPGYAPFR